MFFFWIAIWSTTAVNRSPTTGNIMWSYLHIYIYVYIYMYVYIYICVCVYVYIYMCVYICHRQIICIYHIYPMIYWGTVWINPNLADFCSLLRAQAHLLWRQEVWHVLGMAERTPRCALLDNVGYYWNKIGGITLPHGWFMTLFYPHYTGRC